MRCIGELDPADAQRVVDRLRVVGVKAEVRTGDSGGEIWVHEEAHVARSREVLGAFRADPAAPEFAQAAPIAEALRQKDTAEAEERIRLSIDVRTRWTRFQQAAGGLTMTLIVISFVVAAATRLGEIVDPVLTRLAIASYTTEGGWTQWSYLTDITVRWQVWRLVTPIFIHYGVIHLFFNMFWLHDLGGQIEKERGWVALGALVLVCAISSNLAQYAWSGPRFGGMSGVVYGLFGYIWAQGEHVPASRLSADGGTVNMMLAWLVVCMTGAVGPVANAAHVMGLVVGWLIGWAPAAWRRRQRRF